MPISLGIVLALCSLNCFTRCQEFQIAKNVPTTVQKSVLPSWYQQIQDLPTNILDKQKPDSMERKLLWLMKFQNSPDLTVRQKSPNFLVERTQVMPSKVIQRSNPTLMMTGLSNSLLEKKLKEILSKAPAAVRKPKKLSTPNTHPNKRKTRFTSESVHKINLWPYEERNQNLGFPMTRRSWISGVGRFFTLIGQKVVGWFTKQGVKEVAKRVTMAAAEGFANKVGESLGQSASDAIDELAKGKKEYTPITSSKDSKTFTPPKHVKPTVKKPVAVKKENKVPGKPAPGKSKEKLKPTKPGKEKKNLNDKKKLNNAKQNIPSKQGKPSVKKPVAVQKQKNVQNKKLKVPGKAAPGKSKEKLKPTKPGKEKKNLNDKKKLNNAKQNIPSKQGKPSVKKPVAVQKQKNVQNKKLKVPAKAAPGKSKEKLKPRKPGKEKKNLNDKKKLNNAKQNIPSKQGKSSVKKPVAVQKQKNVQNKKLKVPAKAAPGKSKDKLKPTKPGKEKKNLNDKKKLKSNLKAPYKPAPGKSKEKLKPIKNRGKNRKFPMSRRGLFTIFPRFFKNLALQGIKGLEVASGAPLVDDSRQTLPHKLHMKTRAQKTIKPLDKKSREQPYKVAMLQSIPRPIYLTRNCSSEEGTVSRSDLEFNTNLYQLSNPNIQSNLKGKSYYGQTGNELSSSVLRNMVNELKPLDGQNGNKIDSYLSEIWPHLIEINKTHPNFLLSSLYQQSSRGIKKLLAIFNHPHELKLKFPSAFLNFMLLKQKLPFLPMATKYQSLENKKINILSGFQPPQKRIPTQLNSKNRSSLKEYYQNEENKSNNKNRPPYLQNTNVSKSSLKPKLRQNLLHERNKASSLGKELQNKPKQLSLPIFKIPHFIDKVLNFNGLNLTNSQLAAWLIDLEEPKLWPKRHKLQFAKFAAWLKTNGTKIFGKKSPNLVAWLLGSKIGKSNSKLVARLTNYVSQFGYSLKYPNRPEFGINLIKNSKPAAFDLVNLINAQVRLNSKLAAWLKLDSSEFYQYVQKNPELAALVNSFSSKFGPKIQNNPQLSSWLLGVSLKLAIDLRKYPNLVAWLIDQGSQSDYNINDPIIKTLRTKVSPYLAESPNAWLTGLLTRGEGIPLKNNLKLSSWISNIGSQSEKETYFPNELGLLALLKSKLSNGKCTCNKTFSV